MRAIFITILFLTAINISCFSCNLNKIDSLFTRHIKSLENSISKDTTDLDQKIYTSDENRQFVEMFSFISDIKFELQGYTLQPMIDQYDLDKIVLWYNANRKRLNWKKIEKYNLLYKQLTEFKTSDMDEYERHIESVIIEMSELKRENTFISD